MANLDNWLYVSGTENFYSINRLGKVRGEKRNRLLSPILIKGQYAKVNLCVNGVRIRCYLHILMAHHFIPNPNNLPEINHKDGNKHNYALENLEWCTHSQNIIHYYKYLRNQKHRNIADDLLYKICDYVIPIGNKGTSLEHKMRYQLRQMVIRYAELYKANH